MPYRSGTIRVYGILAAQRPILYALRIIRVHNAITSELFDELTPCATSANKVLNPGGILVVFWTRRYRIALLESKRALGRTKQIQGALGMSATVNCTVWSIDAMSSSATSNSAVAPGPTLQPSTEIKILQSIALHSSSQPAAMPIFIRLDLLVIGVENLGGTHTRRSSWTTPPFIEKYDHLV